MGTDKPCLEKKLMKKLDTNGTFKKTDYNAKITVTEGKTPIITSLATAAPLNAVENSVSNVSDLLKKTDYEVKISDIEIKYLTITDYNNIMGVIFNAKMKAKGLLINLIFSFYR